MAQRNDPERKRILKDIALADQFLAGGQPQAHAAEAVKQDAGAKEFRVTAKTTRADIEKLPSGTRVVMPDGTSKIKK